MTQQSLIKPLILILIEQNGGEFHGIEDLTLRVGPINNKKWVRSCVRNLQLQGEITITQGGGRGRKTVLKRNRNSPGAPRKVRRHE